jgi:CDP-diacylglycerol pyrophosphatase
VVENRHARPPGQRVHAKSRTTVKRSTTSIVGIVRTPLHLTASVISIMGALCLVALFFTGLPNPKHAPRDYATNLCFLARETVDPHLPCPERDVAQIEKPADREALWSVIRTLCIPASYFGVRFPCVKVDRTENYAIVESPTNDRLDFVITPTTRIAGIESLVSGLTDYPNLWRIAWRERSLLQQSSARPLDWDAVALAVNSRSTRSQDQLHIHLGCINAALRAFLAVETFPSSPQWLLRRPDGVGSGVFMKILPREAIDKDFFRLIFDEIPGGKTFAEKETIVVAGVKQGAWRGFALMVTLEPTPAEAFLAAGC